MRPMRFELGPQPSRVGVKRPRRCSA